MAPLYGRQASATTRGSLVSSEDTEESSTKVARIIEGPLVFPGEPSCWGPSPENSAHINGFVAYLEDEEAMEISKYPGVISVLPNRGHKLHTTRSWDFLGLERDCRVPKESLWTKARFGEDTIIENLDTGAWLEAERFKDDGMGPLSSRWKGVCHYGANETFTCNRIQISLSRPRLPKEDRAAPGLGAAMGSLGMDLPFQLHPRPLPLQGYSLCI